MFLEIELANLGFIVLIIASAAPSFTTVVVVLLSLFARTGTMMDLSIVATNRFTGHHDGGTR